MDYKYCLADSNNTVQLLFFELEFTKKEFIDRFDFDYYLKLEFVDNGEYDQFYVDEDGEDIYGDIKIISQHIKFIREILSMFDNDCSEVEIVEFFNENFNPPHKNLVGTKLVLLDYDWYSNIWKNL